MINVSIIVPVYNVAKYLDKCVQSILNQSFSEYELILVDDGSTDDSNRICDEYSQKDSRITVIHKENGGLSSARNSGLDVCQGEYILFIDSDDWIANNMLEILYELSKSSNADIVQCDYELVFDDDDMVSSETEAIVNHYSNLQALNNLTTELGVSTTVSWNKLYKSTLFENIRFPVGKLHEDEFTTYKLLYNANKIIYTNRKLYYYRQRDNSIMGQAFNARRLDALDAFEERVHFITNLNDKELYTNTIVWYFGSFVNLYMKAIKYLDKDKNIIRKLKSKRVAMFVDYFKGPYKNFRMLVKIFILMIYPDFWVKKFQK